MNTKISRVDKSLPLPRFATDGACGFDLYSRDSVTILPGHIAYLPSNLIIQVPADHVLVVAPRSSLARKKGLEMPNSIGIIDQDFCGPEDEILIQLRNVSQAPVEIERGERIAQGMFLKMSKPTWEETDTISTEDQKSRGGFGSTGGYGGNEQINQEHS